LGGPKAFTLQALVLGLEVSNQLVPSHSSGIFVDFIMEFDGLEFESENVALKKGGSSKNNEVSWCRTGSGDSAAELDDAAAKYLDVLSWFLEQGQGLELVDKSLNGGGADLLKLVHDSREGLGSGSVHAEVLLNGFPERGRVTLFKIAFPLHLRLSKS
jgi:hypothetical protein